MPQKSKRKLHSEKAISARWEDMNLNDDPESMDEDEDSWDFRKLHNGEKEDFKIEWELAEIGDLFELCLSWRDSDAVLSNIGAYRAKAAHHWAKAFLLDETESFYDDGRGGRHSESFYDVFPELETEAKAFAIESCSRKSADFTVLDLANFIDTKFYELTQIAKSSDVLIRSVEACRLDLRRWGAKFQPNSQRPYFEGHERLDVIAHRQEFVAHFLQRKDRYYTVTDGDQPVWQIPSQKPCVLLFHDESTFKCGEISAKRWMVDGQTPFFSKDAEFKRACKKYPSLLSSDDLNYVGNSATAGINVGQEGYFDNDTILAQFERLFMLLSFKESFKDHEIEVVVDNARTHSAREYSINDFSKGIDTKCPVDFIEYQDIQGKTVSVSCYFTKGEHRGKSKGLVELAKDLHISIGSRMKLPEIRGLFSTHPAFQNVSRLENLARKYQVKVIFVPKFHCELNAIEGLWCHMKQYIRKTSDQSFPTMLRLLPESRDNFEQRQIHMKLFRRFWRSLDAYNQGKSYGEILSLFFSQSCKSSILSHRKITNSKLQ
ncbi:unnamed protein product [Adineta ricciae]|uniref:Tc1-like transposase DDE domain-containing protein n=1 Tax=Adineta ricciae TaxID=249248 RepID=A0A815EC22_ADIRI|nr:unnamed protein product [Adineta ricciae]